MPWAESPFRVRHAVDSVGRPLLLVRGGGALDRALTPRDGDEDVAMVLMVGGDRGRVWISGWAAELDGLAARAAALEFAGINPVSDLLDVGRGFRLYRLEVAEVRLQCPAGHLTEVDVDDYAAAEPEVSSSPVR
ncbi:hypothetical protein [Catellatospora sp. TT07R-123]|uniref:hypothetical protein n=1 Tax=Catellatospora sp. TT07R-123 TaxID=2733863 RepID=UPI001BB3B6C4|nr:hypothetical protein [Catellatospora sp. TT07R-123]